MERHHRQLILPEVGKKGQAALETARVLVVGCGGLGAPVIQYLAAAGVGRFTLCDDDFVEVSNLNRQVIHRARDVGRPKVERAREFILELDPELSVETVQARVTTENARALFASHALVLDCTDGFPSKYLLNDASVAEDRPLVHGAAVGMVGQVMLVRGRSGPCLRCMFPELPPPEASQSCQEAGVLGATCGVVGALMASEAVKFLVDPARRRGDAFHAVDVLELSVRSLNVKRDPSCPACGDKPSVNARRAEDYVASCSVDDPAAG
jgi:molybdopterin/thiamine biosynthesis adenylyltransferase